jgi:hypothetical protein
MEPSIIPTTSEQHFHDAVTDITVVLGRAQVLRRQFQRGEAVSADTIVDGLTEIVQAGWRLSGHLREAEDEALMMTAQLTDLRAHFAAMWPVLDDIDRPVTDADPADGDRGSGTTPNG